MLSVFHLAIPTRSLESAEEFYINGLGCRLARKYSDRITMDFFGAQVVCHLSPDLDYSEEPKMYPRHFGMTFSDIDTFKNVYELAKKKGLAFFQDKFTRFSGRQEEHQTFFLRDNSNNLLEFKYYNDEQMMF